MSDIVNLSRRDFLASSLLAGGGLILGVHLPRLAAAPDKPGKAAPTVLNAFVRVGADDVVTVIANHSEMGQGVYTGLSMLVAEELDADWSKVKVESAPVDKVYNHPVHGIQITGGSSSTASEYEPLRRVGASARAMLVAAAAAEWKVDPQSCRTENSHVLHPETGRKISYGKLAEAAARLTPPKDLALKDPKDFKLIGKPMKRLDTPEKINGQGIFGIDVTVPGMLVALIARSPVFGGKVKSFNADRAKAIPGVRHVVQVESGIAVVADGYWPAKKGRDALDIVWDEGPQATLSSAGQREQYAELARGKGVVARKEGDAVAALGRAVKKLEAVYELPYLAHAPMEPLNCVADVRADRCEIWTGTQFQTNDRNVAAQVTGLKPEQITIHTTLLGGGFGRRANLFADFVREAVLVSKAVQKPVKVMWTREDDIRGGFYRPAAYHALRGGLDEAGNLVAWQQRVVCQSYAEGTLFEALAFKDGVDVVCVEGAADMSYQIPNLLVDWAKAPPGVSVQHWRSVGHSHTAFAVEGFLDELAHAAGKDPLAFRLGLLGKQSRYRGVLELVAAKSGWGKPAPAGRGRGLAVHESFGSFVAQVVELSVAKDGAIRVHRVVNAVDCGPVVNPDTVQAQLEGCVVFALSATLHGEITIENGRTRQRNFHDYPVLRIHEMPVVETYVVPSKEKPTGVGEPGVPPIAPAVANAIFALTGKRVRRVPIRAAELIK